ncbi:MAG TPA: protein kinase [Kofleriaceae bacterium]
MGRPVDQARAEATRLGSYEIVRKLARGGMAELFLSRTLGPEGFEKLVVLKKILPNYSENPKFVRLFLDEAKLAATLDHPHIAHVYDMGKVDGHYFFTMEYVHGQDVRTTMRRTARVNQRFPIDHAVQIARNVAAALHYAHERRRPDGSLLDIVHRDVSPSNILVSYDGAVKLVDFGVAKATTSTVKTRTGTLKGKISYMSPEQAKGAPIDRRSDIFALGIVLWEMVTTQRLFRAENDLATIQQIINSKPQPPSQLRPESTPELDRVILRALAIDAEQRYQTAEQLQLDLEELAREQKLKQSTVALRTYMHELFADEIRAWSTAQASGQTLTEHMVEQATEMTTPVSESDVYDLDHFDEGDDDEDNPSGTAAPTMTTGAPTTQISVPPPPRPSNRDLAPVAASIVSDQAPTMQMTPGHGLPSIEVDPDLRSSPTPFPIAPREWRPAQGDSTVHINMAEERRKRIIIGSSITFGAIVLIAIAFGGRNPPPAQAEGAAPDRVEMKSGPTVEMTPTAVEPAPAPVPEPLPEPEAAPVEQAAVEPPPQEVEPPPADDKKRPRKSSRQADKQPTPKVDKPAAPTTKTDKPPAPKVDKAPAPKVDKAPAPPKVEKPAAPAPKVDKQPKAPAPKPAAKKPGTYDPNSWKAPE